MKKVYLLAAQADHFNELKKYLEEKEETLISAFENINILTFKTDEARIKEIEKLPGVIAIEEDRSFSIDDPQ